MAVKHFPRTALASDIVANLKGETLIATASAALFLAAPRRTGKTSFLMRDVVPAFVAANITVIYVDLWSAPTSNPADLIFGAIGAALSQAQNILTRSVKKSGLQDISFPGAFKIDVSKIGRVDGVTLTAALQDLLRVGKKPIALIVDEAQHALTTPEGMAAMTALKSARDTINGTGDARNLMLVMSGSDRDKLVRLVSGTIAAFQGSKVQPMPPLDKAFVDHSAKLIEGQFPALKPVNSDKLFEAFKLFGCRPEFFAQAIGEALNPLSAKPVGRIEDIVLFEAQAQREADEKEYESLYLGLDPLEQAVVTWMLQSGAHPSLTSAEAKTFYEEYTGKAMKVVQAVQPVIERLRNHEPPLIWRAGAALYELHDGGMADWYEKRVADGTWPPRPEQRSHLVDFRIPSEENDGSDQMEEATKPTS